MGGSQCRELDGSDMQMGHCNAPSIYLDCDLGRA